MIGDYMETQTTNIPVNQMPVTETVTAPVVVDLGHDKLLSCLYFLFDAFDRAGMEFFLVKGTAKKAMNEDMLEGGHIDIGVRRLEWDNDQKDILFTYLQNEHIEEVSKLPDKLTLKWNDVPFTINIYVDNPCITALIPIVYEHEHWKIPNRFDIFEKEYDK